MQLDRYMEPGIMRLWYSMWKCFRPLPCRSTPHYREGGQSIEDFSRGSERSDLLVADRWTLHPASVWFASFHSCSMTQCFHTYPPKNNPLPKHGDLRFLCICTMKEFLRGCKIWRLSWVEAERKSLFRAYGIFLPTFPIPQTLLWQLVEPSSLSSPDSRPFSRNQASHLPVSPQSFPFLTQAS